MTTNSDVTIITPTLPSRTHLLADAIKSVKSQTVPAYAHVIGVDLHSEGPGSIRNRLVKAAESEWVAFLDDDDVLHPDYIEKLIQYADEFDVVYGWCSMSGRPAWIANETFNADTLRERNFIPVTCMVRRSKFLEVGGFPDQRFCEDHALWVEILESGGRFKCHEEILWEYRYHGSNRTWHGDGE